MTPCRLRIERQAGICSVGSDWGTIWSALLAGKTGLARRPIDAGRRSTVVPQGLVPDVERGVLDVKGFASGACTALVRRLLDSLVGRERPKSPADRIWLHGATNHGESDILLHLAEHGFPETSASTYLTRSLLWDSVAALGAADFAEVLSLRGWHYSACTSGLLAVVLAGLDLLANGSKGQRCAVIAADAFSVIGASGFAAVSACSSSIPKPLTVEADGMAVSEGAAGLILELALPLAGDVVVGGWGLSCDASHPVRPDLSGQYVATAVRQALCRAKLCAADVDAVIAHGTGTAANDSAEASAIRTLWPAHAPPATSLKGLIGHTMGASGLFNLLAAREVSRTGLLPPASRAGATPLPGLDVVLGEPRHLSRHDVVLALSSGFGGMNAAVLLTNT
jgi:3-oxoacyl-(acyl-carrier-protein) synthase